MTRIADITTSLAFPVSVQSADNLKTLNTPQRKDRSKTPFSEDTAFLVLANGATPDVIDSASFPKMLCQDREGQERTRGTPFELF